MEDTTATVQTTFTAELRTVEGNTITTWETDGASTAQEELEGHIDNQDASDQRNLKRMDLELVITKSVDDGLGWGADDTIVSQYVRNATPTYITIVLDVRRDLNDADLLPRAQYDDPTEPYFVDLDADDAYDVESAVEALAWELEERYLERFTAEAKTQGERDGFVVDVETYNAGSSNGTTTYIDEARSDETWEMSIYEDACQAISDADVKDMTDAARAAVTAMLDQA